MIKKLILLAIVCLFATPRTLSAQLVVDLADGAGYDFQGLAAGGSVDLGGAGTPSRFKSDGVFDTTFNLKSVIGIDTTDNPSGEFDSSLNQSSTGIGIAGGDNGAGDDQFRWIPAVSEKIEFSLSSKFQPARIIFDQFVFEGLDAGESFTLQSEAFKALTLNSGALGANVGFDQASGTFTFTGTGTNGQQVYTVSDVTVTDLNAGLTTWTASGVDYTLAFSATSTGVTNAASFKGFSFHAVPEPASMALLAASGIGFVVYRRRKKKVNKKEPA
jgi:hypothetical protein